MAAGRRTAQQGRRTRRNIVVSLSLFRAPVRLAPPYSFSELPEHTFRDLGGMSAEGKTAAGENTRPLSPPSPRRPPVAAAPPGPSPRRMAVAAPGAGRGSGGTPRVLRARLAS